jgi:hypothetical protein
MVSKMSSSTSSSDSSKHQVLIPCKDFKLAVWFPEEVFIPLNKISDLFPKFITSALLILKIFSKPNRLIFSKNSGIIERCAEVIVYLVNKTLIPFDIVSKVRNTVTEKDFPDPLPPVIIK